MRPISLLEIGIGSFSVHPTTTMFLKTNLSDSDITVAQINVDILKGAEVAKVKAIQCVEAAIG